LVTSYSRSFSWISFSGSLPLRLMQTIPRAKMLQKRGRKVAHNLMGSGSIASRRTASNIMPRAAPLLISCLASRILNLAIVVCCIILGSGSLAVHYLRRSLSIHTPGVTIESRMSAPHSSITVASLPPETLSISACILRFRV